MATRSLAAGRPKTAGNLWTRQRAFWSQGLFQFLHTAEARSSLSASRTTILTASSGNGLAAPSPHPRMRAARRLALKNGDFDPVMRRWDHPVPSSGFNTEVDKGSARKTALASELHSVSNASFYFRLVDSNFVSDSGAHDLPDE
jgi:hypothetical protein